MINKSNRILRISKEIKKEMSFILQKLIRDPRLNCMITISNVKLSCDFSDVKIFVIFQNSNKKYILNILIGTSQYIRKLLSQRMQLRKTPKIFFYYDYFFDKTIKIFNIIDKLNIVDKHY